ncbi:MAG: hypothetical protein QOH26_1338 [Actinomycetota bacterium]|jgi:hypothetical protein|nr:hypothetical protein [Actinomycetota bacterium]
MVKKGVLFVALIISMSTALPIAQAEDLSTRNFQTPSGNIKCSLQRTDNLLRCDIRSGLQPEPKKPCELDWVGLLLSRSSRARPNCASDAIAAQDPPVLGYGETWQRRGRICVSRRSGLYCQNFSGYHFKLSRESWDRWYRP